MLTNVYQREKNLISYLRLVT